MTSTRRPLRFSAPPSSKVEVLPICRSRFPGGESIENRTVKLLRYLEQKHPDDEWGQFLQGDQLAWNKIVIGGMSQGGGHALIATRHLVARVLCFGGPKDYSLDVRGLRRNGTRNR